MFYLMSTENVGPNAVAGASHFAIIRTTPPLTNTSRAQRISGWLGTTNDWSEFARGKFETLEMARENAERLGYTLPLRDDSDYELSADEVEVYRHENDLHAWSADDWLDGMRRDLERSIREGLTNEQVRAKHDLSDREEEDGEAINIDGLDKYLDGIRADVAAS